MSASPTTWARASPRPSRRWRRCCSETAKRGLIYLDDGSSPRSVAGQIAGANNLPFAKADIVARRGADTGDDRPRARPSSKRWRASAAVAVGVATALPVSIERIAQWAKAAESRGILLVPITRGRDQAEVELSASPMA